MAGFHPKDCDCFDCDVKFDRLIDTNKFGRIIDRKPNTIEKERCRGSLVPYIKIGRTVRYRARDIRAYLDAHTMTSTSCSHQSTTASLK